MNQAELKEALKRHDLWILGEEGREYADFRCEDLSGRDLSFANLEGANLSDARLYGANLLGANLYGANLNGADLRMACLKQTILTDTNLYGANLQGANLQSITHDGATIWDETGYQNVRVESYNGYVVPRRLQIGCVVFSPLAIEDLLGPDAERVFQRKHPLASATMWQVYGPSIQGAIRTSMLEVPERWKEEE